MSGSYYASTGSPLLKLVEFAEFSQGLSLPPLPPFPCDCPEGLCLQIAIFFPSRGAYKPKLLLVKASGDHAKGPSVFDQSGREGGGREL